MYLLSSSSKRINETLSSVSLGYEPFALYQFHRTERWLKKMRDIYSGNYRPDEPLDYLLAFYLNCYHIKDWLKHAKGWRDEVPSNIKAAAIEQFVSDSGALLICADICNGTKHFACDRWLRSGKVPLLKSVHTRTDMSTNPISRSLRYTLETARGDVDAYGLAEECMECWQKFIRDSTPESLLLLANESERRSKKRVKKRRARTRLSSKTMNVAP